MKWREIREYSESALQTELEKSSEALRNLRFQAVVGQLENPLQLRLQRRRVARIRTLLSERRKSKSTEASAGK
ncbi:50S ribosomal protein L29 [bacterium]|nr:50S ribosomal protein L29 [bacterium]